MARVLATKGTKARKELMWLNYAMTISQILYFLWLIPAALLSSMTLEEVERLLVECLDVLLDRSERICAGDYSIGPHHRSMPVRSNMEYNADANPVRYVNDDNNQLHRFR
jgi:hypothetical protein